MLAPNYFPAGYEIVLSVIGGEAHWEVRDSGGHLVSGHASGFIDAVIVARLKAVELAANVTPRAPDNHPPTHRST